MPRRNALPKLYAKMKLEGRRFLMSQNPPRQTTKRDLTQGHILPHVFRLALPMAWGIAAIISFSIVDTYFIGQLGAVELAAIGYTNPVTTFFFNIIFGLAIAMSSVVSRRIGNKKRDEAQVIVTIGLAIAVLLGILLVGIGYAVMTPVFTAMGADAQTMPLIRDYMGIWFIGALFLPIPIVANAAIRGMGDAMIPAVVMTAVAVVNGILDPIFIFGLFGFPRMELQGAALATSLSYFAGTVTILGVLIAREKILVLSAMLKRAAWRLAVSDLMAVAVPVSLAGIIAPTTFYGFNYILSGLGHEAVAGYGMVSRFEAFMVIPIMALAGGMAPLIGQNWGAGLQTRVHQAIRKAVMLCLAYTVISMIVILMFSRPVAAAFNDNVMVRDFAAGYMIWTAFSYIGFYFAALTNSMMNAVGWAKAGLTAVLVKSFVVALPLAFILVDLYASRGFFMANFAANIVGGMIAVYFLRKIWTACPSQDNGILSSARSSAG